MMKFIALFLGVFAFGAAHAADEYDVQAIQGYDVVAYHTQAQAVKGDGNQAVRHEGKTYLFSSKENKQLFKANPEKYLPAYGGWCAFGVSKGKKFASDATAWSIVDGKLYLNLNAKVQSAWKKDPAARIADADEEWKNIAMTPASQL